MCSELFVGTPLPAFPHYFGQIPSCCAVPPVPGASASPLCSLYMHGHTQELPGLCASCQHRQTRRQQRALLSFVGLNSWLDIDGEAQLGRQSTRLHFISLLSFFFFLFPAARGKLQPWSQGVIAVVVFLVLVAIVFVVNRFWCNKKK